MLLSQMIRLVLAFALISSVAAPAQTCERPSGASAQGVAGLSDEARLAFLSKLLSEESVRAHNWVLAWGAIFGGLGVGQLALRPLFTAEEQPDWYWGAAGTGVGLAFTLLGRPEVLEAGPQYAQKVSTVSADDRCGLIAEGERLLGRGANAEEAGFAWYLHVGNVLFNVGLGLVLGLGYNHWRAAVMNFLIGTAVGEANILSAPAHLISGWKRYQKGGSPEKVSVHVIPTAGPGVGVLMTF